MEDRKCFSFTWIFENPAYCMLQKGATLESPTFVVDTIDKSMWKLSIFRRRENSISFSLRRDENSKGPDTIKIDYELAFLTADGSILKSLVFQRQTFKKSKVQNEPLFENREDIFVKNQSTFLPEGTQMARCRIWKCDDEVKTHGQCIARTHFAIERRCFLWKTENFSTFQMKKESIQIRSASNDKPILSLNLLVLQNLYKRAETINILVTSTNGKPSFFTLRASLIDANGRFVDCGQYEVWPNTSDLKNRITLPLTKDSIMDNSRMYLPNDTLTLVCDCTFSTGIVSGMIESINYGISSEYFNQVAEKDTFSENGEFPDDEKNGDSLKSSAAVEATIQDLKDDISCMFKEQIHCDVKFSVGTETFPAHWFILSARSPVFRAMFKCDMKEKTRDRIDIEDLKADTIRRMLLYMYTDFLEELQLESAFDLYTASDKYQIIPLKDECSAFLKTNLSPTNACEILLLADLHQDKDIKSLVQEFILKHGVDIINSDEWKVLMETNAHLAAETMFLMFKK